MKIKDTYVGIFFLIAIIIVIMFIRVTTRYNESLSETTTNNYHSEFVKDSLKTEQIKKQIELRDSIILDYENKAKIESEKGSILKKQIADLKTKNKELYSKYSENSTIENCDSVLLNQREIISVQDSSILSLSNEVAISNNINYQLKQNNSIKDSLLQSKDNLNELANKNIYQLKKELADEKTWIKNNGYWVTLAIGFVGGVFLTLR